MNMKRIFILLCLILFTALFVNLLFGSIHIYTVKTAGDFMCGTETSTTGICSKNIGFDEYYLTLTIIFIPLISSFVLTLKKVSKRFLYASPFITMSLFYMLLLISILFIRLPVLEYPGFLEGFYTLNYDYANFSKFNTNSIFDNPTVVMFVVSGLFGYVGIPLGLVVNRIRKKLMPLKHTA